MFPCGRGNLHSTSMSEGREKTCSLFAPSLLCPLWKIGREDVRKLTLTFWVSLSSEYLFSAICKVSLQESALSWQRGPVDTHLCPGKTELLMPHNMASASEPRSLNFIHYFSISFKICFYMEDGESYPACCSEFEHLVLAIGVVWGRIRSP